MFLDGHVKWLLRTQIINVHYTDSTQYGFQNSNGLEPTPTPLPVPATINITSATSDSAGQITVTWAGDFGTVANTGKIFDPYVNINGTPDVTSTSASGSRTFARIWEGNTQLSGNINPLSGSISLTGVSLGSHTIVLKVYNSTIANPTTELSAMQSPPVTFTVSGGSVNLTAPTGTLNSSPQIVTWTSSPGGSGATNVRLYDNGVQFSSNSLPLTSGSVTQTFGLGVHSLVAKPYTGSTYNGPDSTAVVFTVVAPTLRRCPWRCRLLLSP